MIERMTKEYDREIDRYACRMEWDIGVVVGLVTLAVMGGGLAFFFLLNSGALLCSLPCLVVVVAIEYLIIRNKLQANAESKKRLQQAEEAKAEFLRSAGR